MVAGSQVVSVILFRRKISVGSNEEAALKSRSERITSKALCFCTGAAMEIGSGRILGAGLQEGEV